MLLSETNLSMLTFWLDAHLSPSVAKWLKESYKVKALSLRSIGLRDSDDIVIFKAAKEADVIFVSKDKDLKILLIHLALLRN